VAYPYRDNYPSNEIDIPHNSYQECCCQHVVLRCMAPYARLMQATQGPKHASNLMHVISRDKFQSCHWPLLEYVVFLALHALRCVLLEIALNAGSACVGRRGSVLLPVWAFQMTLAEIIIALCIVVEHMACWPIFMVRLYIVSDNIHSYIWQSTCRSYRIVSRYFVWYRIIFIYRFLLWLYRTITIIN